MRIVFLGPPGVGKGTQGSRLATHLKAAHISTGEMLRHEVKQDTAIGKKVASILKVGALVSDELIIELVNLRLSKEDAHERFLLDGFPRTIHQAEALDDFLQKRNQQVTVAMLLVADKEEIMRRLMARAKAEGRADDTPDTVAQRLEVYHNQTKPLVGYYEKLGKLQRVDGVGTIGEVFDRLIKVLDSATSAAGESTSS